MATGCRCTGDSSGRQEAALPLLVAEPSGEVSAVATTECGGEPARCLTGRDRRNRSAALVRAGELHPRELVDAAIDRIYELAGRLNAVVGRRFERELEEADDAERCGETSIKQMTGSPSP